MQVATPRVRTAAKAEIPHLEDHVSKLHAVGNMTQNKLQDISAAAIAVGVYNIRVPHNTVTKGMDIFLNSQHTFPTVLSEFRTHYVKLKCKTKFQS